MNPRRLNPSRFVALESLLANACDRRACAFDPKRDPLSRDRIEIARRISHQGDATAYTRSNALLEGASATIFAARKSAFESLTKERKSEQQIVETPRRRVKE